MMLVKHVHCRVVPNYASVGYSIYNTGDVIKDIAKQGLQHKKQEDLLVYLTTTVE